MTCKLANRQPRPTFHDSALEPTRRSIFPWLCAVDIGLYLAGYYVRLHFMSHLAKTHDSDVMRRFFVEELVSASALAVAIVVLWLGPRMQPPRAGQ